MDLTRDLARGAPRTGFGAPPAGAAAEPRGPGRRIALAAAVAAVLVLIGVVFQRRFAEPRQPLGVVRTEFRDMPAVVAEVVTRGIQMPPVIPGDATGLRLVQDRDAFEGWIAFRAPEASLRKLADRLVEMGERAASGLRVRGPGEAWWPVELRGDLGELPRAWVLRSGGLMAAAGRQRRLYVAINPAARTAFVWWEARLAADAGGE